MSRSARAFVALATVAALALSGCSTTVSLTPAKNANDPGCAEVMVRLPQTVSGQNRRWTDAQSTAAWGDPAASVFLTCGVAQLGPTTQPCRTVNGVDWVIDDTAAPRYRVTTFNKTPAVEVYLDNTVASSADVLEALSSPISLLPANGSACTTTSDG